MSTNTQAGSIPLQEATGISGTGTAVPVVPVVKLQFRRLKDTKNTVKYEEVVPEGQPFAVGTLYVQKHVALGATALEVTISRRG